MAPLSREQKINAAFVALADTLTADYDILDLMHTLVEVCSNVLDVQAGGLLLADDDGDLQLLASTSEAADFVEVMQLAAGEGQNGWSAVGMPTHFKRPSPQMRLELAIPRLPLEKVVAVRKTALKPIAQALLAVDASNHNATPAASSSRTSFL
ncbi:MAG: hypothetical protein ABI632_12285, partial [Pseudolysinimonas sp.]